MYLRIEIPTCRGAYIPINMDALMASRMNCNCLCVSRDACIHAAWARASYGKACVKHVHLWQASAPHVVYNVSQGMRLQYAYCIRIHIRTRLDGSEVTPPNINCAGSCAMSRLKCNECIPHRCCMHAWIRVYTGASMNPPYCYQCCDVRAPAPWQQRRNK